MSQEFQGTMYADRFEFIGGWLCLDFANTINYAGTPGVGAGQNERLKGFSELVAWGCLSGLITGAESLLAAAGHHPLQAGAALEEARALRLAIHHVFSAVAYRQTPDRVDMAALNAAMGKAAQHMQLQPRKKGSSSDKAFELGWAAEGNDLRQVLYPVAWSAVELLTSEVLPLVKRCQGAGCAWLFLDETRNHSRRWCDMAHCGNRAKASRHYARGKELLIRT